jgi:hypothetical protein
MSEERHGRTQDSSHGTRLSRRTFLKRALAGTTLAGACGLAACVPPPATTAQPASPAGAVVGRGPRRKVSKTFARYQDRPNRGQRCADCIHFQQPAGCRIVTGLISPNGWSRYFEPA